MDKVEVRQSKFGRGLFAAEKIAADTITCQATGKRLSFEETILLKERESHCLQIGIDKYILCEPTFLYSNHSCNPNCGVNSNLELFTLKNINANEELVWDYSTSMLERRWTLHCECGYFNCRRIIKDFDLLPLWLQEKYLEINLAFPFIAQSYKNAHLLRV